MAEQRDDRKTAKVDFSSPRYVLLHSLAHLLITAVSLDCGYAASAIRERIYSGAGRHRGILLYTTPSGAEGSLGGLVEVGRRLERYLERPSTSDGFAPTIRSARPTSPTTRRRVRPLPRGRLLSRLPAHLGAFLRAHDQYLDRTLVVPTVETPDAAFFGPR